jgi:hypothetical protein
VLSRVDGKTGLEGELAGAGGEALGGTLAEDVGAELRQLQQSGEGACAEFGGEVGGRLVDELCAHMLSEQLRTGRRDRTLLRRR